MMSESRRTMWTGAAEPAWRVVVAILGAGVAAALIVVGALVVALFAVGVALFGSIRPTAARGSARARALRMSSHLPTRAHRTAADETGR